MRSGTLVFSEGSGSLLGDRDCGPIVFSEVFSVVCPVKSSVTFSEVCEAAGSSTSEARSASVNSVLSALRPRDVPRGDVLGVASLVSLASRRASGVSGG